MQGTGIGVVEAEFRNALNAAAYLGKCHPNDQTRQERCQSKLDDAVDKFGTALYHYTRNTIDSVLKEAGVK